MKILYSLALLLFFVEAFPQDEQQALQKEVQDDLGNVNDRFQENFFEALKQKAIENYEKAIHALEKCLAYDAHQSVVFLELGKNYNALEEYVQAANYLEKARSIEPEKETILVELYESYFLNEQFEEALSVVEELRNYNASFSEDLANLYIINQEYDEALQLLDELDEQWGNSSYRDGLRNRIYVKTGDSQAHIHDLKNRLEEDPTNEQNYLNLIFVYSEDGRLDKAFETAKKLQEINPASDLVHLALYKFYLTEEDSENMIESMKTVFRSEEIDQETKYDVLNDFLMYVSTRKDMEHELMEVVEIFAEGDENTAIFGQLGQFFLETNRKEQALEYFEIALLKGVEDFKILRTTLLLQLELQKPGAAQELSQKALESYPSQPLLYLLNGTALNQLQRFKEAEDMLTFGLDYLIDDPQMEAEFYRQLAVTHAGLKNDKRAAEYKARAAKLETENIHE